jgi:transcriptional regulator with XRE-family HTH domain
MKKEKNSFVEKMLKIRKAAGITQTELAKMIGSSQHLISGWERGAGFPNNANLQKIIKIGKRFGVEFVLEDLVGRRRGRQ